MEILKNRTLNNIVRALSVAAVIVMVEISILVYRASTVDLFKFLLYMLLFVQLPGMAILDLLKIKTEHISVRLVIGLFTGWALVILEYFLSDIIGSWILLYTIGPVLSIVWIYLNFVQPKQAGHISTLPDSDALSGTLDEFSSGRQATRVAANPFKFSTIPTAFFIFIVVMLSYVLVNTQYKYLSPAAGGEVYISIDKAFQAGIINALQDGFPAANPWVAGKEIHYHIFSQVLYAVAGVVFGLTSDFMILSCGPYLLVYSLGLAFYAMFRQFCKRKDRAGLYSLSVMLSNMFVCKSLTSSYAYRIIFINDNYGGYGIAAAITFVLALDCYCRHSNISVSKQDRSEDAAEDSKKASALFSKEDLAYYVLLAALMMVCTGIKAPIALVMIGGLIGTLLLGLILRSARLRDILMAGLAVVGFFFIYKLLLTTGGSSGSGGESIFGFAKLTGICWWKTGLIEWMVAQGIPGIARLAVIMTVFVACFFTAFLLPFAIGYIREFVLVVSKKKAFCLSEITVYAATLVGFVLSIILRYTGHSQIYFGIVAIAFAPLIAFRFFEDVDENSAKWMQVIRKIIVVIFFILLIPSGVSLLADIYTTSQTAASYTDVNALHNPYRSLSHDEYEAMSWIRENTDKDALFATQMYHSVPIESYNYENRWQNCHFVYATYAERNFYLEGSGFSISESESDIRLGMIENENMLYDTSISAEERVEQARKLRIDYIVVSKKFGYNVDLSSEFFELCYSNNDIDIYKVITYPDEY